jgi:protease PrsW
VGLLELIAAVVPPLFLLWYFHVSDRYPEPPRLIWKSFGLGALVTLPIIVVEALVDVSSRFTNPWSAGSFKAFFAAALPEELGKLWVVLGYCRNRVEFDEPMDGLVYGVSVAMGFALVENVSYVLGSHHGFSVALVRALSSIPSHAAVGAIMGYFVALSCYLPKRRQAFLLLAIVVPTFFHGVYDAVLMVMQLLPKRDVMIMPLILTFLILIGTEFYLAAALRFEFRRQQRALRKGAASVWATRLEMTNHRLVGWVILLLAGLVFGLSAVGGAPSNEKALETVYWVLRWIGTALSCTLLVQGISILRRPANQVRAKDGSGLPPPR